MTSKPQKILVIPDTQVRPGVNTGHFTWIGNYIAEKRPDVVVHLGDHWDMASLSRFSEGKTELDEQDVAGDFETGNTALLDLHKAMTVKSYVPRKVLLRGNHEDRIRRFLEETGNRRFRGIVSEKKFNDKLLGWEVHKFLEPVAINGVWFAHYFYNPMTGHAYGGTCSNKLKNIGHSFVMGHQQGLDLATRTLPNGQMQWGLVAGSCYLHDEEYKGPQANGHWRGVVMLHEVRDGHFDPMLVSLDYLSRRYS